LIENLRTLDSEKERGKVELKYEKLIYNGENEHNLDGLLI
jgi:hypothetical protein